MEQETTGKVLSLSDAQVRRVLLAEKWIKTNTKWAPLLPRENVIFAVTAPVENTHGYPLQFRCSWNTMESGKYDYSLLWMNGRINVLAVGGQRKTLETAIERYWKNGQCKQASIPDYLTDSADAERTFREYLIRLHIDYRGSFPGAGHQTTLERRTILDDLL